MKFLKKLLKIVGIVFACLIVISIIAYNTRDKNQDSEIPGKIELTYNSEDIDKSSQKTNDENNFKIGSFQSQKRPIYNPTTKQKSGTINYFCVNKNLFEKKDWENLYNQLKTSTEKQIIIHFSEDDTAFLLNNSGTFVYGTFDKNCNFIGETIESFYLEFPDYI